MDRRIALALVDDDAAFLFELSQRLQDRGIAARTFRDGEGLLAEFDRGNVFDCVCADVRMPGLSGLELQRNLADRPLPPPLILFTGYADVDIAVAAMKAGARDFVGKPIDIDRLVSSIKEAVDETRRQAAFRAERARVASRVAELSERHRQVLDLMVRGLTSKQIASALNINYRTVENYRAAVMDRIGVGSVAQLVRVMIELELKR
ncbi:MAG: response regulator transcription factor [Proteobacteria bacterium]|nr:response regulator transcription factor [Pseudomonadota bacterium]